ncbi:hypothetical protein ABIB48_002745 [Arthrobacter sp. UYCu511]
MCPYIRGARCLGFIYPMGTSAPVKIAASGIQGEFSQPTSQMGGGFVVVRAAHGGEGFSGRPGLLGTDGRNMRHEPFGTDW